MRQVQHPPLPLTTTDTKGYDTMTTQQTATTDTTTTEAGTTASSTDTTTGGGAAAGATDQTGTDATQATDEWANFDADRAKQTIQNQRRAEAELKRVVAEQKAKLDEIERGQLSEQERLKADKDAAEAALTTAREQVAAAKFEAAAVAAGIPADRLTAARAVAGDVVTSDDAGNVTIDTAAFDRLKAEHSYLFGSQAAPQPQVSFGAAASQGPGGTQGHGLTPEQVAMANKANIPLEEFAKYAQRTKR